MDMIRLGFLRGLRPFQSKGSFKVWGLLMILFLVALSIRLYLSQFRYCLEGDGPYYIQIAKGWLTPGGSPFHTLFPPGYPMLIGIFKRIGISSYETAARLVSILSGSALVLAIFFLASYVYNLKTALLSAIITTFYPMLTEYSTKALTESSYTLILTLFLFCGLYALRSQKFIPYIVNGLLIGFAILIRPEGLGFFLIFLILSFIVWFRERHRYRYLLNMAAFFLVTLLLLMPYSYYLKRTTGSWKVTGKLEHNLVIAESIGKRNISLESDRLIHEYRQHKSVGSIYFRILRNPTMILKRFIINIHLFDKYTLTKLMPPLILPIFMLGLLSLDFRDYRNIFLLAMIIPFLMLFFIFLDERLFVSFLPIAIMWISNGIVSLRITLERRLQKGRLMKGVEYFIVFIMVIYLSPYTFRPIYRPDEDKIYRIAGEWIAKNTSGPRKIAFPLPALAYYADAQNGSLPFDDLDQAIATLEGDGVTHLVIDNKYISEHRPRLGPLLHKALAPKSLEFLHEFRDEYDKRIVVYQLLREES